MLRSTSLTEARLPSYQMLMRAWPEVDVARAGQDCPVSRKLLVDLLLARDQHYYRVVIDPHPMVAAAAMPMYEPPLLAVNPHEVLRQDLMPTAVKEELVFADDRDSDSGFDLSDADLCVDSPVDPVEDLSDLAMNEHEFRSMKSILEQTFADGTDMLDIIAAV